MVAPGSKSVNLEAADFDFSDRAFKNRERASATFVHLLLNPPQGSLGACTIFQFPATERVFDVLTFIVRPETRKFISHQKVNDFFEGEAGQLFPCWRNRMPID
jgi:hypothetical protein